jgi:nucleotide-binding universal stress UspA family protein
MIPVVPTYVLLVAGDGQGAAANRVLLDPCKLRRVWVLAVRPPVSTYRGFWLWSLVGSAPRSIADDCLQAMDESARQAIERECASLRDWPVPRSHLRQNGPPVETMLHTARAVDADLIVIGADRGPLAVATQVARHARCAVLAVPLREERPPQRGRHARASDWLGAARHILLGRDEVPVPRSG